MMRMQLHGVKRLSAQTEGFVVISHSKPSPYQDYSICIRVISSSHNGLS